LRRTEHDVDSNKHAFHIRYIIIGRAADSEGTVTEDSNTSELHTASLYASPAGGLTPPRSCAYNGAMILLAASIVILLLVAISTIGGMENIVVLYDLPALLCVLMVTVGCIVIFGYRQFLAGLPAILRRPTPSRTEVANCYRKLAEYTLACGAVLAITLSVVSLYPIGNLGLREQMLITAISVFLYSGWLALFLFVPIAFQFSDGDWRDKWWRFLSAPAVVGVCLLPVVFTGACVHWLQVDPVQLLQNHTDYSILWHVRDPINIALVLATITALRLGMGRLQNRYNWIPICILVGVLWSLLKMMLVSEIFDHPGFFLFGFLFPVLYGCICAIAVLVNRAWFFTTIGAVLAICFIVSVFMETPSAAFEKHIVFMRFVVVIWYAMYCVIGRLCDMFYLSVTRYESFGGLFSKHKIDWLVLLTAILIFVSLYVLFARTMEHTWSTAQNAQCVSNMEQIGIALQNYHEQHGQFPPAYTVDAEGNRLHSWRTLLLPYFAPDAIEPKWKNIYDQIRFDEPWDSEHNRQFYGPDKMPEVYGCPLCCAGAVTGETMYKMIVGDHAIGSVQGMPLSQITRPLEEVAVVVESGWQVAWMSPFDFAVEDFGTAVFANNRERLGREQQILGGRHRRELHILFADGTVKIYQDWKLPLSDIETMSRVRE